MERKGKEKGKETIGKEKMKGEEKVDRKGK